MVVAALSRFLREVGAPDNELARADSPAFPQWSLGHHARIVFQATTLRDAPLR